jgi:hypothetical protein
MDDTLYDGTGLPPTSGQQQKDIDPESITWADTYEERQAQAQKVWEDAHAAGLTEEQLEQLSGELTAAVYGPGGPETPAPTETPDGGQAHESGSDGPAYEAAGEPAPDTVTDGPEAVAAGTEVPGEWVESDTAGTGGAVNAETGEVTAPGEPLPPIQHDDTQEFPATPPEQTD